MANPEEIIPHYGDATLLFKQIEGSNEANSPDGYIIALHGGDTDENDHLLMTEGGLRLHNDDLQTLLDSIDPNDKVGLEIVAAEAGMFKEWFGHKVSNAPLPGYDTDYRQNAPDVVVHDSTGGILDNPFFWMWAMSALGNDESYGGGAGFNGYADGKFTGDDNDGNGTWEPDATDADQEQNEDLEDKDGDDKDGEDKEEGDNHDEETGQETGEETTEETGTPDSTDTPGE